MWWHPRRRRVGRPEAGSRTSGSIVCIPSSSRRVSVSGDPIEEHDRAPSAVVGVQVAPRGDRHGAVDFRPRVRAAPCARPGPGDRARRHAGDRAGVPCSHPGGSGRNAVRLPHLHAHDSRSPSRRAPARSRSRRSGRTAAPGGPSCRRRPRARVRAPGSGSWSARPGRASSSSRTTRTPTPTSRTRGRSPTSSSTAARHPSWRRSPVTGSTYAAVVRRGRRTPGHAHRRHGARGHDRARLDRPHVGRLGRQHQRERHARASRRIRRGARPTSPRLRRAGMTTTRSSRRCPATRSACSGRTRRRSAFGFKTHADGADPGDLVGRRGPGLRVRARTSAPAWPTTT